MKGHSELAIVAPDAPGVLAAIAGALTANRVDVLGAMLGHVDARAGTPARRSTCSSCATSRARRSPTTIARWPRLLARPARAARRRRPIRARSRELIAQRRPPSGLPPRVTPGVATEIRCTTTRRRRRSSRCSTRDRVGVLYAITQTLAELGLDISLAKVSTEGEKVADVFYVTRGGERAHRCGERARCVERCVAARRGGVEPGMSAIDLPPGIGLARHAARHVPRAAACAPARAASRSSSSSCSARVDVGARRRAIRTTTHASTQVVLPVAFAAFALLGVRGAHARASRSRATACAGAGTLLSFTQEASRIATAHVYGDGVALEARRGSWWFLARARLGSLRRARAPAAPRRAADRRTTTARRRCARGCRATAASSTACSSARASRPPASRCGRSDRIPERDSSAARSSSPP